MALKIVKTLKRIYAAKDPKLGRYSVKKAHEKGSVLALSEKEIKALGKENFVLFDHEKGEFLKPEKKKEKDPVKKTKEKDSKVSNVEATKALLDGASKE